MKLKVRYKSKCEHCGKKIKATKRIIFPTPDPKLAGVLTGNWLKGLPVECVDCLALHAVDLH